jgi:hypothetical protein
MASTWSDERRLAPRQPCNVRFSYFYRGQRREAMMTNVSRAGAFLNTTIFPPPGSIVLLESFHDAARGLIVRFVVQVVRSVDSLRLDGSPGIGVAWRRAYCNRGATALAEFVAQAFGFSLEAEAAVAAQPELGHREVFYDFQEEVFRPRAAGEGGPRQYHVPTPRSFMLVRDLPPAELTKADAPSVARPAAHDGGSSQETAATRAAARAAARAAEWSAPGPRRMDRGAPEAVTHRTERAAVDPASRRVAYQDEPIFPVARRAVRTAPSPSTTPDPAPSSSAAPSSRFSVAAAAAQAARSAGVGAAARASAEPGAGAAAEQASGETTQPDVAVTAPDWSSAPFRFDDVVGGPTSPGGRPAAAPGAAPTPPLWASPGAPHPAQQPVWAAPPQPQPQPRAAPGAASHPPPSAPWELPPAAAPSAPPQSAPPWQAAPAAPAPPAPQGAPPWRAAPAAPAQPSAAAAVPWQTPAAAGPQAAPPQAAPAAAAARPTPFTARPPQAPPTRPVGPSFESSGPETTPITTVIEGPPEERAPAKVGVTYSVGNRHFTGFTSHIGERSLRIVTRESAPEIGTRIVVRLPIPRHVGYHIARLSCRAISVESDPLESGGPVAFELQIQVIDDAGNPGGFRKFVRELLEHRKS